jgi:hypothetical protein
MVNMNEASEDKLHTCAAGYCTGEDSVANPRLLVDKMRRRHFVSYTNAALLRPTTQKKRVWTNLTNKRKYKHRKGIDIAAGNLLCAFRMRHVLY